MDHVGVLDSQLGDATVVEVLDGIHDTATTHLPVLGEVHAGGGEALEKRDREADWIKPPRRVKAKTKDPAVVDGWEESGRAAQDLPTFSSRTSTKSQAP